MKKTSVLSLFIFITHVIFAQSVSDIVKFSTFTSMGSARVTAMGGAFAALGGELSALTVNPAGIGMFQKPEINITSMFHLASSRTGNRGVNDDSYQLGTLGGVMVFRTPFSGWRNLNVAINYTNLNNFNRVTHQHVYNPATSFQQIWALEANNALQASPGYTSPSDVLNGRTWMANDCGLILYNDNGTFEPTLLPQEEIKQQKWIKEDGYQGEYDLSVGTNYKDKLYLGITIGVQTIHYKYKSIFTGKGIEQKGEENFFGLDKYTFGQYQTTKGMGTNFKFGLIYCPIPELRIAASIHTPTFYAMSDNYSEDMCSKFFLPDTNGETTYTSHLIPDSYDYDMQTPWRATFGLASVLFQKITLSADYEFIDYTSAKFSNGNQGEDFYEPDEIGANDLIKKNLKKTHNLRFGAEYHVNHFFSLRAGYSYWESPYRTNDLPTYLKSNPKIQSVSVGLGLSFTRFYIDAAYIYKFSKDITTFYFYQDPYDSDYDVIAQPIHNKYITHEGCVTLGMRF